MNPVARKRVLGGYAFSAEAKAYFNVLANPPSLQQKIRLDKYLFRPLIANGIFTELDRLWVFASEIEANGLISLVNPTATAVSKVNSPAWVQYQGYTGNATTQYLNTNYNTATSSVKFVQNSASVGVYCRRELNAVIVEMGCSSSGAVTDGIIIEARRTGAIFAGVNGPFNSGSTIASSLGLTSVKRTLSTNIDIIKNGVTLASPANTSVAPISFNPYILALNNNGSASVFSNQQISMAFIGSGSINHLTLYNIIQNYMSQIGSQV